jgi:hypothetical protein
VIFLALILPVLTVEVVSSVSFQSGVVSTYSYMMSNAVGLSMNFDELLPYFNSDLFQNYLLNSNIYGDWYSNFDQSIHMPIGYKFNCSIVQSLTNGTSTCTKDLMNDTLLTNIGNYLWNVTMYYACSIGWDMEDANFTNQDYLKNSFKKFVFDLYPKARYQPFNIEVVDKGDQFGALGLNPNYTATNFVADCNAVNNVVYGLMMTGPGVTEAADVSWYKKISDISYYCGIFTARSIVFQNVSELTIANLLSEKYTKSYLEKRFTVNGTAYYNQFNWDYVAINDIRLVEDPKGIDGLTNSFAAALWAIEMIMEFSIMGGIRLDFYNPIGNASFQSVVGLGPNFSPSPLYAGLLFAIIANQFSPYIQIPTVSPGISSSIKIYGLDFYSTFGVLILNKDINSNMTGYVKVSMTDLSGINCIYFEAPSLSSTSGVKVGGV